MLLSLCHCLCRLFIKRICLIPLGLLVILSLLFLTPYFALIPNAALAAVIIMAVSDMVDFSLLKKLWQVKREYVTSYEMKITRKYIFNCSALVNCKFNFLVNSTSEVCAMYLERHMILARIFGYLIKNMQSALQILHWFILVATTLILLHLMIIWTFCTWPGLSSDLRHWVQGCFKLKC